MCDQCHPSFLTESQLYLSETTKQALADTLQHRISVELIGVIITPENLGRVLIDLPFKS